MLKTDAVEAELLTGQGDMRAAAQMLADFGPREIVLTHRDGLLVHAGGQFHEAGFFPRELVGRSGRGDTCLAAYVARRLSPSPRRSDRLGRRRDQPQNGSRRSFPQRDGTRWRISSAGSIHWPMTNCGTR